MNKLKHILRVVDGKVEIALTGMHSHGGRVWWSSRCNSYVMVANQDKGAFICPNGGRVDILSINGIGEIRWAVNPSFPDKEQAEAMTMFDCEPFKTA